MTLQHVISCLRQSVSFSDSAFEVMRAECQRFDTARVETGGILVGKRLDFQRILVMGATGPGPRAEHQHNTFAPDTGFLNTQLKWLRNQYAGTDFVGFWHKHPPTLEGLSEGDQEQVRLILEDTAYKTDELVLPIAIQQGTHVALKVYYTHRELSRYDIEPVLIDHNRVSEREAHHLLRELGKSSPHWYDAATFQARFLEEAQRLLQHFQLDIKVLDEQLLIVATWRKDPRVRIYFVCKQGYPHTVAPQVFLGLEEEQDIDSRHLTNWHSAYHLSDIAHELVALME